MSPEFSLEELARAVQDWCEEHQVFPDNGQAAEEITERTIRYYRTLGLLDASLGNYTKKSSDKHRRQGVHSTARRSQDRPAVLSHRRVCGWHEPVASPERLHGVQ